VADPVEKVENAAKAKFSQKLAGGRFLLGMRSSCEEEGRRMLQIASRRGEATRSRARSILHAARRSINDPAYKKLT
jgi:hypothetical protein